jgi:Tol biopolymer transport system component
MKHLVFAIAGLTLVPSTWAQVTERISVATGGAEADGGGDLPFPPGAVVSADGRFVVFMSGASNIIPGDTNPSWDVLVRDRQNGTTDVVSIDSNGVQGNGFSGQYGIAITPDGRFVGFYSRANNLVPGDTNGAADIFVRDRLLGLTERISLATGGTQGNNNCFHLAISPDARFVAFESLSTNLVAGDTNGELDIFIRDRALGVTEIVSRSSGATFGNGSSEIPAVSADGRYVAFQSNSDNLVSGDTNGQYDVFLRDRQIGATERISIRTDFGQANGTSALPSISANGRYVAFVSEATNLVAGDTNAQWDVFVHDRRFGTTERVSIAMDGAQGNGASSQATISSDGRFVVFKSNAPNLVAGGTSGLQIFLRDRLNNTTEVVSRSTSQVLANGNCECAAISDTGRYVAFRSAATNLAPVDTNASDDVFIHDRQATGFTSLCDPGTAGVIACPCSNAPSGLGRGCENSASTGGARLSATGISYLSIDSLVFTTSDERPTALSILAQWTGVSSTGSIYGMGVRCTSGTLKRLFTKSAVGGSITAPDFGNGDPTVSSRSASLGSVILPGESRWYFVYYRDPNVLGGCPTSSTFNATQTGQVTWWP